MPARVKGEIPMQDNPAVLAEDKADDAASGTRNSSDAFCSDLHRPHGGRW
jgi:hypothetical protein